MRKLAVLTLIVALAGCKGKSNAYIADGSVSQSGATISGYLTFETTYTVQLSGQRSLIVTATSQPWLNGTVYFSDELQQEDGKRVYFECDKIAEKIIDARLVAEIEPICPAIHQRGEAYWKALGYEPNEFVDAQGTHWLKVAHK